MTEHPLRLAGEEDGAATAAQPPWRPTASPEALAARAGLLRAIREFFHQRGVMEVETPCLSQAAPQDVHLQPLAVRGGPAKHARGWLHTSPEYAMKRLLAAGAGPIYQLCKVFRGEECGRLHNPEFTLLEWYRPALALQGLMDEVDALLASVLERGRSERLAYGELFQRHTGLDPHSASDARLRQRARRLEAAPARGTRLTRESLLDLLFSQAVQPHLGHTRPVMVYDWPACQAALARLRPGPPAVAERFELYLDGVELANGYQELTDPVEHSLRLELERSRRRRQRLPELPPDARFLAAVYSGLPACAGVALGVDRLLMVMLGVERLQDVLAFPIDRA